MAFRMQAPWKNPRSENLWFRRRVPSNLVGYMGKREIKFSLGTADPVLAKIRFQEENAKLERVWHEHLHGQEYAKLSQRQLSALAGQFYQEMIAAHSDNPGRAFDWQLMVKRDQERIAKRFPLKGRLYHMRETFGGEARAFLEKKGYRLSGETLDMFIEEFVRTKLQAAEQLVRNASFNYADDPHAGRFAPPEVLKSDGKVAAIDMFEKYANEAQLDGKTRESWETKIKSLIAFVGHDDLARLTSEEVIAWKDKLLVTKKRQSKKDKLANKPEEFLDPKTIRNSYIAAVKATLNYAKQQGKVSINVAKEVTVRVRKRKKQREKGFSEEEANMILKATMAPPRPGISPEYAQARRWVPWICAYTGARVNEITQLKPSDFKIKKGSPAFARDR